MQTSSERRPRGPDGGSRGRWDPVVRLGREPGEDPVEPARSAFAGRHADRVPRRPLLTLAAALTVAAGLGVRTLGGSGPMPEVAGDALYAVLVYLLVALLGPVAVRARPVVLAVTAWGLCAVVELAQLTGLPAAAVAVWEPARWVLGTTFHAPDLLVYAVGAALAGLLDAAATGRASTGARRSDREPGRPQDPSGRRQRARAEWASEPPPAARRSTR